MLKFIVLNVRENTRSVETSGPVQLPDHILFHSRAGHANMLIHVVAHFAEIVHLAVNFLYSGLHAHFRKAHLGCAALLLELQELDVGHLLIGLVILGDLRCHSVF